MIDAVNQLSLWIVPMMLLVIPLLAFVKRIKVYEVFIEGAEKGFSTAIKTIPYLVAMLVAISIFRASGAMDLLAEALAPLLKPFGVPSEVIPLAIMRPLSGSGALGMTTELISVYGPDSLIGRLASTMQGSTDTTFYILTLYFGSVGVIRYRYAPLVGIIADVAAFLASAYIVVKVFA